MRARKDIAVTPLAHVVRTMIWGQPVFFTVNRPRDDIQKYHLSGAFYEAEELEIIRRACPPGAVFCDIGANFGNHSLFVLMFLHAARVIVFEPNPAAIEILLSNLALNGVLDRCDTRHLGVGLSDVAQGGLSLVHRRRNLGGARMVPSEEAADPGPGLSVVRGDDALRGQKVDFIKIDVEGMEMKVLGGLAEIIAANRPKLFVEVDNANRAEFDAWLARNEYEVQERFQRYPVNENFLLAPKGARVGAAPLEDERAEASLPVAAPVVHGEAKDERMMTTAPLVTAAGPSGGQIGDKLLFTAVRNEGPFLIEWLAYHRTIGFDRIVVFENDSDDGTTELLAALHEVGVLSHLRHSPPEGVGAQVNAARIANETGLLDQTGWAAWLDADEFLNIHAGAGRLEDLIAHLDRHQGMLIPWRVFGDNGHDVFSGRFLSEDFTRAAKADAPFRNELKTFFRLGDAVAGLSLVGINRPTLHAGRTYPPDLFLCANGNAPDPADRRTRRFYAGEDFVESAQTGEAGDGWVLAQINHYLNRTPEHFLKKKYRGNGWKTGVAAANDRRRTARFYQRMNRNDAEDRSILRHLSATDAEITRLRSLPGVAEAETQVLARHAAWLAEHKDEIAEVTGALRRAKAIS